MGIDGLYIDLLLTSNCNNLFNMCLNQLLAINTFVYKYLKKILAIRSNYKKILILVVLKDFFQFKYINSNMRFLINSLIPYCQEVSCNRVAIKSHVTVLPLGLM